MQALYLSTNGDTTTRLANPLEVHEYGCAVIEISGKVVIPRRLQKSEKAITSPNSIPKPPENEHDEDEHDEDEDELNDQSKINNNAEKKIDPTPEPKLKYIPFEAKPPLEANPAPPPQNLTGCSEDVEEGFSEDLYLCCNIIQESYVGNRKMPVLRYLRRKNGNIINEINHPIWLTVMRPAISSIRLYIADDTGKVLSLPRNNLNCTLLFVPTKY